MLDHLVPLISFDLVWMVRPTELLVDLREAIQQLGRHFQSVDPELSGVSLAPDYTMESHARDHDAFVSVSSKKQRRAKALLGTWSASLSIRVHYVAMQR